VPRLGRAAANVWRAVLPREVRYERRDVIPAARASDAGTRTRRSEGGSIRWSRVLRLYGPCGSGHSDELTLSTTTRAGRYRNCSSGSWRSGTSAPASASSASCWPFPSGLSVQNTRFDAVVVLAGEDAKSSVQAGCRDVPSPASRRVRPIATRRVSSRAAGRRVSDNDDVARAGRSHVACAA
jgi:hypothetical protein